MDWATSIRLHDSYKHLQEIVAARQKPISKSLGPSERVRSHLRVVALHIPYFHRRDFISSRQNVPDVTILRSISADSAVNPIAKYSEVKECIPIPDIVDSCGPSIVTFLDPNYGWYPVELIIKLFLGGFGDATMISGRDQELERYSRILIQDFQDLQEISLPKVDSSSLERKSFALQSMMALPTLSADSVSSNSTIRDIGQSVLSNFSSPASFMTANSPASFVTAYSPASFMTARSTYNSPALAVIKEQGFTRKVPTINENEAPELGLTRPLQKLRNDYYTGLNSQNILEPFDTEKNWSGRGQHVVFTPHEEAPLKFLSHLGSSLSASVSKVLCRRIAIARKTMRCSRHWTVADSLREVYHLHNLRHAHIVQLVGSYLQGRNFSILLYPVADYHLGQFLEDTSDLGSFESIFHFSFLTSTFCCLASTIAFIHENTTKHMDIKPQNILVRKVSSPYLWRIYVADFGLSRSFASGAHSQTDGPTARTPRYCAPEVFKFEQRGRSADVFSLGCVYLEILTVLCGLELQDFADQRRGSGDDESFHANLTRVSSWTHYLSRCFADFQSRCWGSVHDQDFKDFLTIVEQMVEEAPNSRPKAAELVEFFENIHADHPFGPKSCCKSGPEPYEAHDSSDLPTREEAKE